jgi:hypothetical protein
MGLASEVVHGFPRFFGTLKHPMTASCHVGSNPSFNNHLAVVGATNTIAEE